MSNTIEGYLLDLKKHHKIVLSLSEGELKLRGEEENITPGILEDIRSRKSDILSFLESIEKGKNGEEIPKADVKPSYALSSAQQRVYFTYELDRYSLAYNIPTVVKLEGELNVAKMKAAFTKLTERHESLRTYFSLENNIPVQKISDQVDFPLENIPLNGHGPKALVQSFVRPFVLSEAPLIRAGLVQVAADEYLLIVDMHHIITDGTSTAILIRDFMSIYNEEEQGDAGLQYKDFSEWQQKDSFKNKIAHQKKFWVEEFSDGVPILDLPTDRQRPKIKNYAGEASYFNLTREETGKVKSIALEENTTLYMALLAVYGVMLSKLSGQEDVVIGSSTAGRNHPEFENTIGMFVNTLPIRVRPIGSLTLRQYVQEVKSKVLACYKNQEYPYVNLIEDLNLGRDTGRNPIFDVMFDFQNFELAELEIPGLLLKGVDYSQGISKFDLTLTAVENNGQIQFKLEYSTELFESQTIDRLIQFFQKTLSYLYDDIDSYISDISLVDEKDQSKLLIGSLPVPDDTLNSTKNVLTAFQKQVSNNPKTIAAQFEDQQMTYETLDQLSNKLAQYLVKNYQVSSSDLIGVELDHNLWIVVSILGIMKSGAGYVPVDPHLPTTRKEHIAKDAGIKLMISEMYYLMDLDYGEVPVIAVDIELESGDAQETPLDVETKSTDLAYLIYTSGSTGTPKGVMIEHGSLMNYVEWASGYYLNGNPGNFPLFTSISFDLTITSIFIPLITGGKIVICQNDQKEVLLRDILTHPDINIAKLTPSHLQILKELSFDGQGLKDNLKLILGGEELVTQLAHDTFKFFGGRVEIYNEYGPTEATVGCMIHRYDPESKAYSVPIGRPIHGTQVYLLDKYEKLVPEGVFGEIYIAGVGLAEGYINNEKLTVEKFVDNPFAPGQKMYKTRDKACLLSNGDIAFKGRMDDQVKIRGYRIEPGEIEHQLMQYPGVSQAAVLPVGEMGAQYLAAYYVSEEGYADHQLREHLLSQLPEYMVPSHYLHMDQLPLTSNGKLDKRALPSPKSLQKDYQAPTTQEEQLIAEVFESVLGCEKVGITDDFFELGGDSIKSIQISSRLRDEGFGLTVQDIFRYRTISHMAKHLETLVEVSDQSEVEGTVSLTPIQHWFWSNKLRSKHHFNQSVMLRFKEKPSVGHLRLVFEKIQEHHDGLRLVFRENDGEVDQYNSSSSFPLHLEEHDLTSHTDAITAMGPLCDQIQSGIDLSTGPLMRLGLFHTPEGSLLLVAVHHLVIDGVSWRILFEDIDRLYAQVIQGEPLSLSSKTDSYQRWSEALVDYQNSVAYQDNRSFWESGLKKTIRLSSLRDYPSGGNTYADQQKASFTLTPAETSGLLKQAHVPFGTSIDELLLTSLVLSLHEVFGLSGASVVLENHGREDTGVKGMNTQRTIGWFTTMYPVLLEYTGEDLSLLIRTVKESLRQVPNKGMDYMLYRYSDGNKEGFEEASVSFNYLGQFDTDLDAESFEVLSGVYQGLEKGMDEEREYDWDISGIVVNGCLEMGLFYSGSQYSGSKIGSLMSSYGSNLKRLISYCLSYEGRLLSPSDFTYKQLSVDQVDLLANQYNIQDVYPLGPLQEGILFHSLKDLTDNGYYRQLTIEVEGNLDISLVEKSMLALVQRHDILRTAFLNEGHERPLQVVLESRGIDFGYADISNYEASLQEAEIKRYGEVFKSSMFDLSKDTLIKLQVLKTAGSRYLFVFGHHHILMDGWCMSVLLNDFKALYVGHREGVTPDLDTITPYSEYIKWLEGLDKSVASSYWSTYLEGYEGLSSVSERVPEKPFSLVSHDLLIDADRTAQLHALSAAYGVTINVIIQVAWGLLLSRYNHTDEVVFGAVVSGRPTSIKGIESMVGLFINTVPVRIGYGEADGIEALMRQVQDRSLGSEPHHYHPLSEIQALRADQTKDLFDHIITFENYPLADQIAMNESASADSGLEF